MVAFKVAIWQDFLSEAVFSNDFLVVAAASVKNPLVRLEMFSIVSH